MTNTEKFFVECVKRGIRDEKIETILPFFYIIRWFHVLFTRPKNIGKLKKMNNVKTEELVYMKEIRNGLGINHL